MQLVEITRLSLIIKLLKARGTMPSIFLVALLIILIGLVRAAGAAYVLGRFNRTAHAPVVKITRKAGIGLLETTTAISAIKTALVVPIINLDESLFGT